MPQSAAEYLAERFEEVPPIDYYKELFPIGTLEKKGEQKTGEYCAIAIEINDDKARRIQITDGLEELPPLIDSKDFVMLSPVLFAGRRATKENARFLQALIFDLDCIRKDSNGNLVGLEDLLYQTSISKKDPYNRLPKPTFIIASSYRNLHIVYLLEKPLAMYSNVVDQIRAFRKAFVPKLWSSYISDSYKSPQYESSPVQAFRLCGSNSKDGKTKVRCFRTGPRVSIEMLNSYVEEEAQIRAIHYRSNLRLEEAKELYPEWYQRRIEQGLPPHTWQAPQKTYEWFMRQLPKIEVGHRYHFLYCLASFGIKCGIDKETVEADIMFARAELDKISPAHNPLTMRDARNALQGYRPENRYLKREAIAKLCGLKIEPAKRNYRKQSLHLKLARSNLAILNEENGKALQGCPSKEKLVLEFAKEHPDYSNRKIAKELGISKDTVNKYRRSAISF